VLYPSELRGQAFDSITLSSVFWATNSEMWALKSPFWARPKLLRNSMSGRSFFDSLHFLHETGTRCTKSFCVEIAVPHPLRRPSNRAHLALARLLREVRHHFLKPALLVLQVYDPISR
jgi:hypothetical protein